VGVFVACAVSALTDEPPMSGAEFRRNVHDDLDQWADRMMQSATDNGLSVEREWLRGWLGDAMDAARKSRMLPINPEEQTP
jgi:hypothetical protein